MRGCWLPDIKSDLLHQITNTNTSFKTNVCYHVRLQQGGIFLHLVLLDEKDCPIMNEEQCL